MTEPTFTLPDEFNLEQGTGLAEDLKVLLASAGWKYYINIVESQQQTRLQRILLQPLPNMDAVLEQEFTKGEVAGMKTALALPGHLLDDLNQGLEVLRARRAANPDGDPE